MQPDFLFMLALKALPEPYRRKGLNGMDRRRGRRGDLGVWRLLRPYRRDRGH